MSEFLEIQKAYDVFLRLSNKISSVSQPSSKETEEASHICDLSEEAYKAWKLETAADALKFGLQNLHSGQAIQCCLYLHLYLHVISKAPFQ